jgi:prepilin peptidase CpaA
LGALLAAAAATDIRERRVPNGLNLTVLLCGVAVSTLLPSSRVTLLEALMGIVIGLGVWLPMYLARLIGAGDAKLMAASGAWLGGAGVLWASLWAAIAGGVLGLVWIVGHRGVPSAAIALGRALRTPKSLQLQPMDRRERVPYAVAIALGVIAAWFQLNDALLTIPGTDALFSAN